MAKRKCKGMNVKKTHSLEVVISHTHTKSSVDEDKLVIKVTE